MQTYTIAREYYFVGVLCQFRRYHTVIWPKYYRDAGVRHTNANLKFNFKIKLNLNDAVEDTGTSTLKSAGSPSQT